MANEEPIEVQELGKETPVYRIKKGWSRIPTLGKATIAIVLVLVIIGAATFIAPGKSLFQEKYHMISFDTDRAYKDQAWFQNLGPKDAQGRSLRELDLKTRVFRYPLSFLIYSEGFDALPRFVRERVYAGLARVLQARDPGAPYDSHSAADREAAYQILIATKPEFAQAVTRRD